MGVFVLLLFIITYMKTKSHENLLKGVFLYSLKRLTF